MSPELLYALDSALLTALHSVVNHWALHAPISHCCTATGLACSAHWPAGATVISLPIFWTQMMSRRWVPFPHAALHWDQNDVGWWVTFRVDKVIKRLKNYPIYRM